MIADQINGLIVSTVDFKELRAIKDMLPKWTTEVERRISAIEDEELYGKDPDEAFWQK